jgi:predicted O-methyltransferase YrrM
MTAEERWSQVDDYITGSVVGADPALHQARQASDDAGLPPIAVSAPQGKLLRLLAQLAGARNILEIGTLGGYSTIWLAGALPAGGRVVTLEVDPRHAEVARSNLAKAGLDKVAEVIVGPALETLDTLQGPLDFTFIDADKVNTAAYFDKAVRLSRAGAVIVVDNVVRNGALSEQSPSDPNVAAMRRFHDGLATRSDVDATTIQTVGSKGYDGFTLAVVKA